MRPNAPDGSAKRFRIPWLLVLLSAAGLLSACGHATGPTLELALAKARWEEERPASYEMTVSRSCECLPEMSGPVELTVEGGTVTSRRYTRDGEAVAARFAPLFPDVDGLFDVIEDAMRADAASIVATWEPRYGYPVSISIDYHEQHVDDEITWRVRDFAVRE